MKAKEKKTRLTLTVRREVVERAKETLKTQSLSQLVETYLERLIDEQNEALVETRTGSLASSLQGCATSALSRKTDREIKSGMHRDRHGV